MKREISFEVKENGIYKVYNAGSWNKEEKLIMSKEIFIEAFYKYISILEKVPQAEEENKEIKLCPTLKIINKKQGDNYGK